MTSEATSLQIALRDEPQAVMLTNQQLVVISNTDFVAKGMRGNVSACLACVARARAMGIPDIVALGGGISIINGKAVLAAELLSAIARAHGHSITWEETDDEVVCYGKRADNGDEGKGRFTMEMAKTAGLLSKDNWKRHPDDMMFARAMSKLCRRLFSDCYAGATYTPQDFNLTDEQAKQGDYVAADLTLDESDDVSGEEVMDEPAIEVTETDIALGLTEQDTGPATFDEFKKRCDDLFISPDIRREAAHHLFGDAKPENIDAAGWKELWDDVLIRSGKAQEALQV